MILAIFCVGMLVLGRAQRNSFLSGSNFYELTLIFSLAVRKFFLAALFSLFCLSCSFRIATSCLLEAAVLSTVQRIPSR